jgi:C-terminal processing protease CtpA/Prc
VHYDEALAVISKAKENPTIEFTLVEESTSDPEPAVGADAMPTIIENTVRKVVIPASSTGYGLKVSGTALLFFVLRIISFHLWRVVSNVNIMTSNLKTDFGALCLQIVSHPNRKGIIIDEVVAGSPAESAVPKVCRNDIIVSINDMHALEIDHDTAMKKIAECRDVGADLELVVGAAADLEATERTVLINKGTSSTFGIGMMVDAQGNFRVHTVANGSPADVMGVQASERILSIDGVDLVAPDAWQAWEDHLQQAEKVTLVTIPDGFALDDEEKHSIRTFRVTRGPSGFGMSLKSDRHTKGVRVAELVTKGPADTAGLRIGDVLLHINGEYVFTASHDEVITALARSADVADIEVQHRSAIPGGERMVELNCQKGAGIQYGTLDGKEYPQIMGLVAGMPAEMSEEVLVGDHIHMVNGVSLLGKTHEECDRLLRQPVLALVLETGVAPYEGNTAGGEVAYSTAEIEKPAEGSLGLEMQSEHFGISGALGMMITSILPNSAADRCPDIACGDVVHAINGTSIEASSHDEVGRFPCALTVIMVVYHVCVCVYLASVRRFLTRNMHLGCGNASASAGRATHPPGGAVPATTRGHSCAAPDGWSWCSSAIRSRRVRCTGA